MAKCRLTKKKCPASEECPWWLTLIVDKKEKRGRCALVWIPILMVELRTAIEQKTGKNNERTNT